MFRQLGILVAAGLAGPILASFRSLRLPMVIGELAAGALIGNTGLHLIDPKASAFPVFYSFGFAMLMLTAGTHVDVRSPAIRRGAPRGLLALAVVVAMAVPVGIGVAAAVGLGHQFLVVVLLAGSSAAVAFPTIEERGLTGASVAYLTAWIALADTVTVVLMPLGLTGGGHLISALVGDAAIIVVAALLMVAALRLRPRTRVREEIVDSRRKGWALQLRLSVLLLLVLAAIAEGTGASTLVAGFAAGMVLIHLGEPDRLALQISGLANGFFVPIFFVLLGAELDLRALVSDPRALTFALLMAAGATVVHVLAASVTSRQQRLSTGLAATAQLGLPAAAAALALQSHALSPALAAALVAAGCLTLLPATIGATRLASD